MRHSFADFADYLHIGFQTPDFILETATGEPESLSSLRGKAVVLEFGAITCPRFLGQVARIDQLKAKYGAQGVVYVRDPHPGEPAYRKYVKPENMEQCKQYAQELADIRHTAANAVVDTTQDEIYESFGSLPNMVYVRYWDATIANKAMWALADKIHRVRRQMTAEQSTPESLLA